MYLEAERLWRTKMSKAVLLSALRIPGAPFKLLISSGMKLYTVLLKKVHIDAAGLSIYLGACWTCLKIKGMRQHKVLC